MPRHDLTDEELHRLENVRKQTWKGGYAGFVIGSAWGLGNCFLFKTIQRRAVKQFPEHPMIKALPSLQNKHFVMWTLVAGASGMFLGAVVEGMRGSESLRDIYDRRANEAREKPWTHAEGAPEYHVERANADSHARRSDAIATKRREESGERGKTASKSGGFKAW